jgi:hypothetical protein
VFGAGPQTLGQLFEERALLKITTNAWIRRSETVERHHLPDRKSPAKQHYDFFEVRTGHRLLSSADVRSKAGARAVSAGLHVI